MLFGLDGTARRALPGHRSSLGNGTLVTMQRVRVTTTVDSRLLDEARVIVGAFTDEVLFDRALEALLGLHRSTEIDAAYAVYDHVPLDSPDDWGSLASFRGAGAEP